MLGIVFLADPAPAFAYCLTSADPAILELQLLVDEDAQRALKQAQIRLQIAQHAPQPDAPLIASLYAVQAHAYDVLELDDAAREAASKGLGYVSASPATD